MEIAFHITQERIKKAPLRAKIAAQMMQKRKTPDLRGVRDLIAAFMVDEDEEPLDREEAREIIEELDDDQLEQVGKQLSAALAAYNVPKTKGKKS
jgi:hypothetical protein